MSKFTDLFCGFKWSTAVIRFVKMMDAPFRLCLRNVEDLHFGPDRDHEGSDQERGRGALATGKDGSPPVHGMGALALAGGVVAVACAPMRG